MSSGLLTTSVYSMLFALRGVISAIPSPIAQDLSLFCMLNVVMSKHTVPSGHIFVLRQNLWVSGSTFPEAASF